MDAYPMVVRCALHQPIYGTMRCACGEDMQFGAWRCATCSVRAEVDRFDALADLR